MNNKIDEESILNFLSNFRILFNDRHFQVAIKVIGKFCQDKKKSFARIFSKGEKLISDKF